MSIRKHGRGYQVRLPDEPARSFPIKAAAERYELHRRLARSLGDLHAEAPITVREMLDGYLHRWQTRQQPAPGTVERARDALKFLDREFGPMLLKQLSVVQVEDTIIERATEHPNSAKKELEWFKRALKDAHRRRQRFDMALLMIDPIRSVNRTGVALDVDQLDRLASWFPEHLSTLPLFVGSVGLRIGEALGLTDDRVNLDRGTVFVPAALCKERRDKLIELIAAERKLIAEALVARPNGTTHVWPRFGGGRHQPGPYSDGNGYFYSNVWHPAREAAAREWQDDHGQAPTPFDQLVPHDLRHTAISLMAAGGMRPETIAVRVGHKDGGKLILERYRHLFPDELGEHLERYETFLIGRRAVRRAAETA